MVDHVTNILKIFSALEVGLEDAEEVEPDVGPIEYETPKTEDQIDPEVFNRGFVMIEGQKYCVSVFVFKEPNQAEVDHHQDFGYDRIGHN